MGKQVALNELDTMELEEYNALQGLAKEKHLEEKGLMLLDMQEAGDGTQDQLWTFDISHKLHSAIILFQKEGETFDEATSRMVKEALQMFVDNHKELKDA